MNESELLKIRDRMTSRGPDGAGAWVSDDRRVGLAHRRLSIIDLSPSGAQPMFNDAGTFGIVFNGEIYNYRELRVELEKSGFRFRSTSDTEVLLHLYADRGVKMLDALRGMYGFALWDNSKKALFVARDPYGIKPVYFSDNGRTIRVASQVKALLAGGAVDTTPNPAGHVGFFVWGHIPDPHTLYRGIRAVQAGTYLWIQQGQAIRETGFCSIPRLFENTEDSHSNGTAAKTLREALCDTVRHHLIADVPVGVFLSSGIDSTTLTALAAEEGGKVQTVTLAFEEFKGTENDEAPLAEEVARAYGSKHETVWVSRGDFENQLENVFSSMDQPTIDGINTYWVSRATRQTGLKVALSGLGGDELFGGYPSFSQIPRLVKALRPFQSLKQLASGFRSIAAPLLKRWTSPKYAGLFEYGGSYGGAYMLRRGLFMPWELPEILDVDLAREGWKELQSIASMNHEIANIDSPRSVISCMESCWYMKSQLLRDADWAGMAHSLEIRVPLVDMELLRFYKNLARNDAAPGKRNLGETPLKPLPSRIISRPKTGFVVPVREWLLAQAGKAGNATTPNNDRGLRAWSKVVYGQLLAHTA